jgi:DNA mismatch repair protein MutL
MPIRVLEPEIVSLIAAGEVVERPASVVKELVENSLDASATQVSVETRGGGVSLIRVTDDGIGIPATELDYAFQRHATSKITGLDDLELISSLGFRGEALPSIATVAEVDMVSCASSQSSGGYLHLKEGAVTGRGSRGRAQGTTVTVRDLFRNVPARLKFLKSPATENSHIANVVSQYALAFPEVRFTLSIDGRTVLRTPGSGRLIDCVTQLYGLEVAQNMLEINGDEEGWERGTAALTPSVSGMIGSPTISRSNRGHLSFFVNRRWVNSRLLTWAVEEAYHGLLMQGKHPVAIINLTLSPKEMDVNIHPTKIEVKFQNERPLFATVQKTVRRALVEQAPAPRIEDITVSYEAPSRPSRPIARPTRTEYPSSSPFPAPSPPLVSSLPTLRPIGQLASTYIVAEGPDGLYLIDQHAAHERILFEKIRQQREHQEIEVQGLLEPLTLEVNPKQDVILKAHYERLVEFGFSIEPFGDRTYLVRAVPALLQGNEWMEVLREMLDSPPGEDKASWQEKMTASIACHSAIRAGQLLNDNEMRELIQQLEKEAVSNTCPHGRPTTIHLSSKQLEREFGRS